MLPAMKHRTWVAGLAGIVAWSLACSGVPPLPEVSGPADAVTDAVADVDTGVAMVASSDAPQPAEPALPAEPLPADEVKGAKRPPSPAPSGITQVSTQSWRVDQALVDRWKDDPYELSQVREEGDGWELLGVRQRNAYHLGMRNRDVLLEANGHKLNTRAQLLVAYLALKNDRVFDLVFLRQGKRLVHHYEIER